MTEKSEEGGETDGAARRRSRMRSRADSGIGQSFFARELMQRTAGGARRRAHARPGRKHGKARGNEPAQPRRRKAEEPIDRRTPVRCRPHLPGGGFEPISPLPGPQNQRARITLRGLFSKTKNQFRDRNLDWADLRAGAAEARTLGQVVAPAEAFELRRENLSDGPRVD